MGLDGLDSLSRPQPVDPSPTTGHFCIMMLPKYLIGLRAAWLAMSTCDLRWTTMDDDGLRNSRRTCGC